LNRQIIRELTPKDLAAVVGGTAALATTRRTGPRTCTC